MSETLVAKELQLVSIFSDNYRFEIPEYQRPYAWTTEQTGELLDDLLHAIEHVEDVSYASPYFLGSIVTIKDGLKAQAQIVDGQQRITTLTILLCVLRELAPSESDRNDTHTYIYAPGRESAGIQGHYRLSVREMDRGFFQDNIQKVGRLRSLLERSPAILPDSQKRMLENAHYLYNALVERDEKLRKILTQFLAQRCYLVVVSASNQNSAYRIFSVLNDRGLDLSPTDILKADIIGSLEKSVRSQYARIWDTIEEGLGRERFRALFAHIYTIAMTNRPRGTLQQNFQDHVLKTVARAEFIDKVLEPYADAYQTVTGASYQGAGDSESINKHLRYLNWLDNSDWIPPAMAFYRRHHQDPDMLLRFLRDLERLAYKMFILRANINQRTRRYRPVLHAIKQKSDLFAPSSPLQLSPDEQEKFLGALDGPVYSLPRVPRTLLLRLDSLLADKGARYEHSTITIEHVLPRNPERKSQWLIDFPDEEERAEWTDKLANLVLLSRTKNSRALNHDFGRKKREYFQKGGVVTFALTSQVLAEDEWTPAVLQRRQRELTNALKKEWRLEEASSSPPVHTRKVPNEPAYTVEEKRREHPKAYKKWSLEDDDRLKEMYAAGHEVAEMAKHFERNEGAIRSRLKKLELNRDVVTSPIYEETRQLVEQGLTLEEVARRRGRPTSTIVVHLERLLQEGSEIDLRPLLPPDRFEEIRAAFEQTGGTLISPIKDILGEDYSYEESRVVHLYLQQQDRTSQSGQSAVTDPQGEQSANVPPPTPPAQKAAENAIQPGPIRHLLKQHFGYDEFLPFQEKIITAVLEENDALVLMPTGGGKSLCYQLPAMHFEGLTLVVSPLISLMKDQVDTLRANNIPAAFINSTLSPSEIERVQLQAQGGVLKILYAAPERLSQSEFQRFLATLNLRFVAVDEAHCISMWGHEFRPDYRKLGDLRRSLPSVPVLALTATATEQVRADIVKQLHLQQPEQFVASFNRPNLSYSVLPKRKNAFTRLLKLLQKHKGEPVIIYCTTKKSTENLASQLRDNGFNAQHYHAGLEDDERPQTQERFMHDQTQIIVATIAFGMGIDKSNVRLIVHYDLPKTLEGYYQETGRAGRDGLPSDCVLFYSHGDVPTLERFINNDNEDEEIRRYMHEKLGQVIKYCQLQACRRKYLLRYFGEEWPEENCGGCDFCRPAQEEFDATAIAHHILSAVIQTGERFGITHVAAVLRGSGNAVVKSLGHDKLSIYGTVDDYSADEIKEIAGQLVEEGLLRRNEGESSILSVTHKARRFLTRRTRLVLTRAAREGRKVPDVRGPARDIDGKGRKRREKVLSEGSTYEKTRQMWEQGLSVEEIAKKRTLKRSRIVYHLQRLIEAGVDIDLRPMLPPAVRIEEIRRAIEKTGSASLSPAKNMLGDKYPYYEIKLVWLFLHQQGKLQD
ncbi:MAG: DNA helicase RecQ [Caldilineaceae bacterium]|nr:DNA helicase RecQ [Caldilineaceae bacterium]